MTPNQGLGAHRVHEGSEGPGSANTPGRDVGAENAPEERPGPGYTITIRRVCLGDHPLKSAVWTVGGPAGGVLRSKIDRARRLAWDEYARGDVWWHWVEGAARYRGRR